MKGYLFFLLNLCFFVSAQEMLIPPSVQDSIFKQLELFPQEKIHLHTDRTAYVPGEKIWFKVYLVDAYTHQFPTYSQYVYVELISSSDSLIQRVLVSADENRLLHGHIFLSEIIPEGDYTIRAYTRYLENLGDDYFFKKNIRIGNISEVHHNQSANSTQNILLTPQKGDTTTLSLVSKQGGNGGDYDISFFPEGGYITEGVINRVAFKAINQNGASENITGEIVDDEGNPVVYDIITVFAGMGSFALGAEPGKTYYMVSKNSAGQTKRFPLPSARKTYTITSLNRDKQFIVQLKKSPEMPQRPLYLFIHCKGEVICFSKWDYSKGYVLLSANQLPTGIIQILLIDEQMNPISERLIFNKPEDQTNLVFSTDQTVYVKRDRVIATVNLPSPVPLEKVRGEVGHFSISITDNADISIDSLHTITANLLLSSELRGYIESPDYYLQNNRKSAYALDHLMLTHGWRRYELSETFKGKYTYPETEFESTKEISGSVKSYLTGRPVLNRKVLLISNDQSLMQTTTDSDGKFLFQLHYPDSALFFASTNNQRDRITLNQEIFPQLKHAPVSISLFPVVANQEKEPSDIFSDFIQKAGQRAQYDEDIKVINLQEIEITASRIEQRDRLRLSSNPFNASSDRTIYREDMERMPNTTFAADFLWLVAGARVQYDKMGSGMPVGISVSPVTGFALIYIDGMLSTIEDLNNIPSELIESIDVFKGSGATMFGTRGANGAISVTTGFASDKVKELKSNAATITPLGYQKPVEFYSPRYDTPESGNFSIPDYRTTIFWKPDLWLSDDGKASFDFYTSDFPTTYSVVIEGITKEGQIIRQVERIEVR